MRAYARKNDATMEINPLKEHVSGEKIITQSGFWLI